MSAAGCTSVIQRAGVALYYREAPHPADLTRLDLPYAADDEPKHRLDLFVPDRAEPEGGAGSPVLVFVHGGGFTEGDRATSAGGADVYRNIGRFYASRGVLTAIISYRLQPAFDWHQQLSDVALAVEWVREHASEWGGDPNALFLSGHSAGAYLSARHALDRSPTGTETGTAVCGLVLISGAAYQIADEQTYALGASREWFVARFDDGAPDWETRASVTPLVRSDSPPALVVYASGEPEKLRRQSDLLLETYRASGADVTRVVVPGEDHQRIVLTLSRADKTAGPAILDFVTGTDCSAETTSG